MSTAETTPPDQGPEGPRPHLPDPQGTLLPDGILNLVSEGIVVLGTDGRVLAANLAMGELCARPVSELIGKTAAEAWKEKLVPSPPSDSGTAVVLSAPDGSSRVAWRRIQVLPDSPDNEIAIYRAAGDASANLFRSLIEGTGEIVLLVDRELRIRYASPAAGLVLTAGSGEVVGRPAGEVISLSGRQSFIQSLNTSLERTGEVVEAGEFAIASSDAGASPRMLTVRIHNQLHNRGLSGLIVTFREVPREVQLHRVERILAGLGEKLGLAVELEEVGRAVLKAADDLFGWDAAFFSVYDPSKSEDERVSMLLVFDLVNGERREFPSETHQPTALVKAFFQSPSDMVRLINYAEPRQHAELGHFGVNQQLSRSLLYGALRDRERNVVGIISIQSYTPDHFDEDAAAIFRVLADYTGAAVARTQAERALRHRETLYRRAIARADAVAYERDLKRPCYYFMEEHIKNLTGYTAEELTTETWRKIVQETILYGEAEGLPRDLAARRALSGEASSWKADIRILARDGTERWLADSSITVFDEQGCPDRALGILQDITFRKQAEQRQRRTALGLQRVVEIVEQLIAIDDQDELHRRAVELPREKLGVIRCSLFVRKGDLLWGTFGTDENGKTVDERAMFIPVEVVEIREFEVDRLRRKVNRIPLTVLRDGKWTELHSDWVAGTPLLDRDGRVLAILYNDAGLTHKPMESELQDILSVYCTALGRVLERKADEVRVRDSEQRFRFIIENMPASLWTTDTDLKVIECTGRALETIGVDPGDLMGRNIAELDSPDGDRAGILAYHQRALAGESVYYERTMGGHVFSVNLRPLRSPGGRVAGVIGLAQDIDEYRRLQKRIADKQKLESLGALTGGIAHDFNNLLSGILLNADLAKSLLTGQLQVRDALDRIENPARRMAELTQQMLAYAGQRGLKLEVVDLGDLLLSMKELVAVTLGSKGRYELEAARGSAFVEGEVAQMRQIIVNLVSNAAEALGEKGGRVIVRVCRQAVERPAEWMAPWNRSIRSGDHVILEVEDTGCGIPADVLSRIFDPFYTTKFVGRGLGLAAVHGIVRSHRGAIRIDSAPGKGTRFCVALPAIEPPSIQPQRKPRTEGSSLGVLLDLPGPVLVVDDEEPVLAVCSRILERAGATMFAATNGQSAIELFGKNASTICAVLLDLTMPKMSGDEVFLRIRAIHPDVPVVLMSGYSEEEVKDRFKGHKIAGYLTKPFMPSLMLKVLKEVTEKGS